MAIDTKLRDYLQEKGINCYYKDIQVPDTGHCPFETACPAIWSVIAASSVSCTAHVRMQITESQKNTGSNHAISALKFKIIKEFLDLGYSVLLSDIDIVWLDVSPHSPFGYFLRLAVCLASDELAACPFMCSRNCLNCTADVAVL